MITLAGSRFIVSNEGEDYKVCVINDDRKLENVTESLTDDDKDELIWDLIYAVTELLEEKNLKESEKEGTQK